MNHETFGHNVSVFLVDGDDAVSGQKVDDDGIEEGSKGIEEHFYYLFELLD